MKMTGFWLSCSQTYGLCRMGLSSLARRRRCPSFPKVETMVRGLRPALLGRFVERIEVHDPFLLQGCDAEEFERRGRRVQVEEVARRGKWVVITLSDHRGMIVIQPRMTGGFWLVEPPSTRAHPPDVPVGETRGDDLVLRHTEAGQDSLVRQPRRAAAGFRPVARARMLWRSALEDLAARLRRTRRGIKPTLMDQKVLAGIGNIYADEILFAVADPPRANRRRLSPRRAGTACTRPIGQVSDHGDRRRGFQLRRRAIALSWGWKVGSLPRTPCTAARDSPAAAAASRSRRRRSPA